MPHEKALLRAILKNPDQDGPRLTYADWLTQKADARGEFIRVQCELARMPNDNPRREELKALARQLLRKHHAQWLEPLSALLGTPAGGLIFQRGFIEHASVIADKFLTNAKQIFQQAPLLHSLCIDGVDVLHNFYHLVALPHLAFLTDLDLSNNALGWLGAKKLTTCPHLTRLKSLKLNNCALTDEGLRIFSYPSQMARLAEWALTDNRLSDDGLFALAQSPQFAELTSLHLGHDDRITRHGLLRLAGSPLLARLTTIHWYEWTDRHTGLETTEEVLEPEAGSVDSPLPAGRRVRLVTHVDQIW